jgi:hypothetical protein
MTLFELDRMIEALENSSPTFSNCQKLASLYICRDNLSVPTIKGQNKENIAKSSDPKSA